MTAAERIREQLRVEHADCDDACRLGRLWAEDVQEVLTLGALAPTERAERTETVAQLIHQYRHRAGTSSTCGDCRAVADTLARVLLDEP